MAEKITDNNLEEFKKLIRKATFLESHEEIYFQSIPNEKWRSIFEVNFGGNWNYAQRVILNKFREIDTIDTARVDREKFKIHNLDKATKFVTNSINDKSPILFITDFDNDGSLAQAIINEYLKIDTQAAQNMHVHYAQTVNGNSNRGFTVDLVDRIIEQQGINPNKKFLIVTADNGINSVEEQLKIQAKYPEAEIVVTDHHNPDPEMVIQENDKVVIFNPHYKPTDFYKNFNISGATTVGVLLRNVLKQRFTNEELNEQYKNQMDNINKLSKVSNLLDYVHTDPADKPEKDYVISKFLKLQPLLNINNSISKIITGEIAASTIQSIKEKIPNLDSELLYNEAKNIHIQNKIAKILLKIYADNKEDAITKIANDELAANGEEIAPNGVKNAEQLNMLILKEINEPANYIEENVINPNYIEQLRPLIFGLSADDTKNSFMDSLTDHMIGVYESIKTSEKKMAEELRRGEVITKSKLEHSVIAYTDKNILTVFNRKFLNKVYNDENPGFTLTLDNIDKGKVSGSFRSLYDISDILKDKAKLEKSLKVKIETPGHERAAGFIVKSLNPEKNPINKEVIDAINMFINNSISKIKELEVDADNTYLLTDLGAIKLLDRINRVVRGNVSNFERITPLLKLTPDTVYTDSYSTQQFTMEEIANSRKYGYITININFHGDTVIVPVELVRKIVENDYKDYLNLGYMDGGVFMAEKVVTSKEAKNIIDLRDKNSKTQEIAAVFEKDFKDKNYVNLTRDQIQDNPFFKYHDYGRLNFDLFERMVIGIIDSNNIDMLTVFDVEANGFGNSKLMNLGAMNYTINQDSGTKMTSADFNTRLFATQRGDEYLLTTEQVGELTEIPLSDISSLAPSIKKLLLVKANNEVADTSEVEEDSEFPAQVAEIGNRYYYHPAMEALANKKTKSLPFTAIKNYLHDNTNETVTYNREIQATMLAYLVNDNDFRVPQEMTNLTGITQELLNKHGKPTALVDQEFADYYKGLNVLFGAHNTPYDARVLRANTPKFYEILKSNQIYDSALFSREKKLTYDEVQVSNFEGIDGLPKGVYFFNNLYSEFSLSKFLEENKNGYYPDRTGNYLLSIEDGKYYLVDKEAHEIIKIDANQEKMLMCMRTGEIPNVAIKYSVEKLSEQWMVHALLLSDEKFEIQHVDLNDPKYANIKMYHDQLVFFQDNYHFDTSAEKNFNNLQQYYSSLDMPIILSKEQEDTCRELFTDFLEKNKTIQQKFSDAWMYKKVLEIKEPGRNDDITNDLLDLVQFQTALPRDKIVTIYKETLAFKKKYKIDHLIQHEGHINGPWEGDNKGDIAFEDKLTLSLLAQRNYDPYNHSVRAAVKEFNEYSLRAREAFEKADKLSNDLAQDSYSYRQGLLYNRESKSEMIRNIQNKEYNNLFSDQEQVIIFKLNNDVLPQDTNVCAVVKNGVSIDREQLESDSDKLSFIVANEQLKYSLKNDTSGARDYAQEILNKNDAISQEYKKDLLTRYRHIEHNKKVYQVKKFIDTMITIAHKGSYKPTKTTREMPIHDIGEDGFNTIQAVFEKYVETANKNNDTRISEKGIEAAKVFFEEKISNCPLTSLENALAKMPYEANEDNTKDADAIKEPCFLNEVHILRQNPIKNLLKSHKDLRLLNQFIEFNSESMKEDLTINRQKPVKKKKLKAA